jgi:PTH1 family peptidyl-tRNA hydrolase
MAQEDRVPPGRVLLVGLGNPGPKYELTRHNIGFLLMDKLSRRWAINLGRTRFNADFGSGPGAQRPTVLLKPKTFMNLSGQAVSRAMGFFEVEPTAVIVAHDDIDLPWQTVRIKLGGGAGGHKGLRSIDQLLGTRDYFRIRLGIGRPEHGDVSNYVLQRFNEMQLAELDDVLTVAACAAEMLLRDGLKATQNEFHGAPPHNQKSGGEP